MRVTMCKAKLHRATVTEAQLHYEGSITIDEDLLEASGILPFEKVQVVNINNGSRFETYAFEEKAGSGTIGLYGAAAHLGNAGDLVIILSYAMYDDTEARRVRTRPVYVDSGNALKK